MTLFSKLSIIAFGASLAAMTFSHQDGSVQAASGLSQCNASSRQKVIDCCNEYVAEHPQFWMTRTHTNCRQAVGCRSARKSFTSAAVVKICSVQRPLQRINDGKGQTEGKSISDIRLKTSIHRIGTTVLGLPLYTFKYRNKPGIYAGVMAQDVLKVKPSAVSIGTNGYYMVDYSKLGIAMERIQ
jgi:hypothetical protein